MSNSIIPTSNGQTTEIITVSQDEWDRDKTIILNGLKTIDEVNEALKLALIRVNSSQSYFLDGYKSFEECCKGLFKISKRTAYRIMNPNKSISVDKSNQSILGAMAAPKTAPPAPPSKSHVSCPNLQSSTVVKKPKEKSVEESTTPAKKESMSMDQAVMAIKSRSIIDQRKAIIEILSSHDHVGGRGIWMLVGEDLKYYNKKK